MSTPFFLFTDKVNQELYSHFHKISKAFFPVISSENSDWGNWS